METIVLLGPPGAGKGTQAAILSQRFGHAAVNSGEMLREAVARGTVAGRTAREYIDRGALVPDQVVTGLVVDALARHGARPVVLDGFPKTVPQAVLLDRALAALGRRIHATLVFVADRHRLAERLRVRAAQEGRADDRPETVAVRLAAFGATPRDLIDHLRRFNPLHTIDANHDVPTVTAAVHRALGLEWTGERHPDR